MAYDTIVFAGESSSNTSICSWQTFLLGYEKKEDEKHTYRKR